MSAVPTPGPPDADLVAAVREVVPAIARLEDEQLQEAVAATWAASLAASPFATLADVPQSPVMVDRPLLAHINEVNDLADVLMALSIGHYGLAIDHDVTLATAILHDVDKPLIFRRDGGGAFGTAPGTSLGDHGAIGARLALANGVPEAIAELVRRHSSFASEGLPGTAEGTIIHYADIGSNDLACVQVGAAPVHSSVRLVPKAAPAAGGVDDPEAGS
jgi:putative nucleotidyltransferase with HDIG domain